MIKALAPVIFFSTSHPVLVVALILTVAAGLRVWRSSSKSFGDWLKSERVPLAIAAALVVAIVLSVPPRFRTLSDEGNLVSVAQSFIRNRTPELVHEAKRYYGLFIPVQPITPYRPVLQPFLVSIVDALTGPRLANAFFLNALVLFGLLSFLLIRFRRAGSLAAGGAVSCLLLAQPIVAYTAMCAGFDLLALGGLVFATATLHAYARQPDEDRARFFLGALVLFSYCRYESVAIAFVLGLGALSLRPFREFLLTRRGAIAMTLTVLALVPLLAQAAYLYGYNRPQVPSASVAAFSAGATLEHTQSFASYLFTFKNNDWVPLSIAATWSGVLAVLAGATWLALSPKAWERFRARFGTNPGLKAWVATAAAWLGLIALFFSHFRGNVISLTEARFFLTLLAVLALMPGLLILALRPGRSALILTGLAIAIFVADHPTAVQQRYTNLLYVIRTVEGAKRLIPRLSPDPALVVHDRSNAFLTDGYASVDYPYMNSRVEEILTQLRRRLFQKAYAVQTVTFANDQPTEATALDPRYRLREVGRFQLDGERYIRVSEITVD